MKLKKNTTNQWKKIYYEPNTWGTSIKRNSSQKKHNMKTKLKQSTQENTPTMKKKTLQANEEKKNDEQNT